MKPRVNSFVRSAALASSVLLSLATLSTAATFQWDGNAVGNDGDWARDANWTGSAPDDANLTGDHRLNVNGATALIYSADQGTSVFARSSDRGLVIGSGSSGTMIITGGSFSSLGSSSGDVIGNGGGNTGILTINGGAFIGTAAGTNLGVGGGPTSTLNVQSGSATLANLNLHATTATINLSGTGILEVNNISRTPHATNTANINFDGGTLKARTSTTAFLTGLNTATVNAGGVTVDSNNFNITIGQSLLGGTGSGGLTKTGAGTLTLTGTNTYTGATTLTQGAISVGATANLGAAASNLVFDGGTLQITGTTLTSVSGIGHSVSFNAGKLVALDINSSSNTFTVDQVLNQTTGGFTKLGAGRVVFTQANTYSGETTISAGAIIRQVADTTTGNISVASGATFVLSGGVSDGAGQSLSINGSGAGDNYFYTGSAQQRGSLQAQNGANTWAGDIVINGTSNTRIGVQNGASLTLSGHISESVAGSEVLFRAGAVGDNIILSGTGSWTGATTLFSAGGSIRIMDDNRLSTAASVLFTTGGSTVFDLNGFNQEFAGIESISAAITIRSDAAGSSTLTSNTPTDMSFNSLGNIAEGLGTVSFVKQGAGTQTFSRANTYTGDTTITGGTLALSGSGSINNSALIDVQSSATLSIAGVTTSTILGNATAQTLQGVGTVNLGAKTLTIGSFGTLAPGASPGTLEFIASAGGKLDFAVDSTIAFELGTTSDLIAFTSAGDWLSGSGNATLALTLLGEFDYANTYTIFENVTTTGFTFAEITGYDTDGYTANFSQNGNNYDLSFTIIPEPRAALLGGLGLLFLLRRRRNA